MGLLRLDFQRRPAIDIALYNIITKESEYSGQAI